MTDNEIIKALECCSEKICKQCPNFSEDIECSEKLIKLALDLINRQQAENERLSSSAAIKEFAERLKTKFHTAMSFSFVHIHEEIDNLVKEMTEGNGNA